MLEAARLRRAGQRPVLLDDRGLTGEPVDAGHRPQAAGIQRQPIRREMLGLPGEHTAHAPRPRVRILLGQAVHEIDADVVEAGLPHRLERPPRSARVVQPSQDGQDRIVQRLHPQADPIHPRRSIRRQLVPADALRVALDRDFRRGRQRETAPDLVEDSRHVVRTQQRRRPAAEKDSRQRHRRRPRRRGQEPQLATQRSDIPPHLALVLERRRIERTIETPLRTERDMDIQPNAGAAGSGFGQDTERSVGGRRAGGGVRRPVSVTDDRAERIEGITSHGLR